MTRPLPGDLGPNKHLIGRPGARRELVTPCLIMDLDLSMANTHRVIRIMREAGMVLWPHAKTHKCPRLARFQLETGAERICVANLHEAETFVAHGVDRLLITSPLIGANKIDRLVNLAARCDDLMIVVGSLANARAIGAAAAECGIVVDTLIDIDVGMGRTGICDMNEVLDTARLIRSSPSMRLHGVQGYSGRVQHIRDYDERLSVYGAQIKTLATARDILKGLGLTDPVVTGGGTGTLAIDASMGIIRQQQSGSYVFMDVQYGAVEISRDASLAFEPALSLRASVVSANVRGHVTIDAGTKSLATDGPKPVVLGGAPEGTIYEFFGDEHGKLVLAEGADQPEPGDGVELVTPHCDPTVNLHDFIHVVSGDTLVDIWPIEARGSL